MLSSKLVLSILVISFCAASITEINHETIKLILDGMSLSPLKNQFKAFHYLYQKPYDLNSEIGLKKYKTFKDNARFIADVNNKNLSYKLGINGFADLTLEEYGNYLNNYIRSDLQERSISFDELADKDDDSNDKLATQYVNWEKYLPPHRDQGECGSCWAFACLGATETNYKIKFGNQPEWSRQDLVDCAKINDTNDGCKGANLQSALRYIEANGVALEKEYSYTSGKTKVASTCKTKPKRQFMLRKHWSGNSDDFEALIKDGALATGIDGFSLQFMLYKGGPIDLPVCKQPNHAVVAYGLESRKGIDIILIRNSHNYDWGEKGNMQLIRNRKTDSCFTEENPIFPVVKDINDNTPPEPEPDPDADCLELKYGCNSTGEPKPVCVTTRNLTSPDTGNTSINLKKFEGKNEVRFYSKSYCRGIEKIYNGTPTCLNMPVKSVYIEEDQVIIKPKCVKTYDSGCFGGFSKELCEEVNTIAGFKVGSLILGDEVKEAEVKANDGTIYKIENKKTFSIAEKHYQKISSIKIIPK